jgi:RNA polymerase sigma-70 factor (ECF subfamily)
VDQSEFISILDAARAGGEWAWSRLYLDLAGPIRGYACARGSLEPDDVVGETFLQVARNLGTFEGEYPAFRSWVFVIAHHRVIDERRRRTRHPEDPTEGIADMRLGGDVEDEALAALGDERAIRALDGLTDDQRSVVVLRVVGDLSLEQTAEVLGKRVGAIKALQKRAFDRLKKTLPGAYPDLAARR